MASGFLKFCGARCTDKLSFLINCFKTVLYHIYCVEEIVPSSTPISVRKKIGSTTQLAIMRRF